MSEAETEAEQIETEPQSEAVTTRHTGIFPDDRQAQKSDEEPNE